MGEDGRVASSEWWGRCALLQQPIARFPPTHHADFRDFCGNLRSEIKTAAAPVSSDLQRVNVYELQFAHCCQCLLRHTPCSISGSRGAAAVAVAVAALKLEVGQVATLS